MSARAVIFANGPIPDLLAARRLIQPGDVILAADGGTRHVLGLGLMPAVIIGDLDSLDSAERGRIQNANVLLREYPHDKDETDLELALQYAIEDGFDRIIIVAALGGHLDQTLGNLSLLTAPGLTEVNIRIDDGVEAAFFTRGSCHVGGAAGDVVSLIPWGGPVTGVVTGGLQWPLCSETLEPHRTRGISNEMLGNEATIQVQTGLLLIVHRRSGSMG
jgi:thiamine pyrophosphokinase